MEALRQFMRTGGLVKQGASFTATEDEARRYDREKNPLAERVRDAGLPDDFPGREALKGSGVKSMAAVRKLDKSALVEIDGIGEATAEKILKAVE